MEPDDVTEGADNSSAGLKYTWSDFQYDPAGKITSWTGKNGPLEKTLWTQPAKRSAMGVRAELVSAYWTHAGGVHVVIKMTATRKTSWYDVSYSPKKGFRRQAQAYSSQSELAKGDKVPMFASFRKTNLPGTVRITVENANYDDGEIVLKIK